MRYLEIFLTFMFAFVYVEVGRQYAHWRFRVWMDAYQRRYSRYGSIELAESFASWLLFPLDSYFGTLGTYEMASFAYIRDVVYVWQARGADREERFQLLARYLAIMQWLWFPMLGLNLLQVAWIMGDSIFRELRQRRLPHRRFMNYVVRLRSTRRRRLREQGRLA